MQRRATLIAVVALTLLVPGVLAAATHPNPAVITIQDPQPVSSGSGVTINDGATATPYPSTATVVRANGTITSMTVSLTGFTHASPDDVDVLLVGPTGASIVLMSDVCGASPVGPISITFSDSAVSGLPDGGPCVGGAAKPTNVNDGADTFPAPAPAPSANATLGAAFAGTDPNGTWSLYVVDDSATGAGSLSSWTVNIVTNGPSPAPASPYPSNITVAGEPATPTGIVVNLAGVTHTFPDDIDVLLVGPSGVNLILMSDTCGSGDLTSQTFTFSDAAASLLSDGGPCTGGTYKPTNFVTPDPFPAPAPAPSANTTLSVFDGVNPNGTWSLYVVDDLGIDSGTISGGWSLTIPGTTAVSVGGLSARARPGAVSVSWRTGSEAEIAGFNVYRGNTRLNARLIRARASGTSAGRSYSLVDRNVRAGASYTYRLQVAKLDGSRVSAGSTSLAAR